MIDGAIVQVCSWLLGQGMEMYITTFMDKEVINVVIICESTYTSMRPKARRRERIGVLPS
jgi:hypothetical protein